MECIRPFTADDSPDRVRSFLPSPGGGGSARIVRCETGRGESLSPAAVFHRFGFGISRTMQFLINPFKDSRQTTGDLGIPKADDTVSLLLQPELSFTITFSGPVLVMVSAIKFDDEMGGRAKVIDDIGTDRRLPPKMRTIDRKLLQGTPQYTLVRCRVGT